MNIFNPILKLNFVINSLISVGNFANLVFFSLFIFPFPPFSLPSFLVLSSYLPSSLFTFSSLSFIIYNIKFTCKINLDFIIYNINVILIFCSLAFYFSPVLYEIKKVWFFSNIFDIEILISISIFNPSTFSVMNTIIFSYYFVLCFLLFMFPFAMLFIFFHKCFFS